MCTYACLWISFPLSVCDVALCSYSYLSFLNARLTNTLYQLIYITVHITGLYSITIVDREKHRILSNNEGKDGNIDMSVYYLTTFCTAELIITIYPL